MNRFQLLGLVLLGFCVTAIGCGETTKKKEDNMPVTSSGAVDPKTGKAPKTFEVGLEDPEALKKMKK